MQKTFEIVALVITTIVVLGCTLISLLRVFWYPTPHGISIAGSFEVLSHSLVFAVIGAILCYKGFRWSNLVIADRSLIWKLDWFTSLCLWATFIASLVELVMFFKQVSFPWIL